MPNKTEHYQLNQYQPGDDFLRTDFNEDNAKVDAAIHGLNGIKAEVVFGTYTGDGETNRVIALGFTPKAVLLEDNEGGRDRGVCCGGLILPGVTLRNGSAAIVENGFRVSHSNWSWLNINTRVMYYLAFR